MRKLDDSRTQTNLDILESSDLYSLALFSLYKLSDSTKYAKLSELPYIIDKDSLFRFLKYYEGQTITIPDISELVNVTRMLVVYQELRVNGKTFREALTKAGIKYDRDDIPQIKKKIMELDSIITTFNRTHNDNKNDA
jgi:hypothetical protein